jgi:hypothetical protein
VRHLEVGHDHVVRRQPQALDPFQRPYCRVDLVLTAEQSAQAVKQMGLVVDEQNAGKRVHEVAALL